MTEPTVRRDLRVRSRSSLGAGAPGGEVLPAIHTARRLPGQSSVWRSLATVGFIAVPGAMIVANGRSPGYLLAAAVSPMLMFACLPWLRTITAGESTDDVLWILVVGLEARMLASIPRWLSGVDAEAYVRVGRELAVELRNLNFGVDTERAVPGTGSIRYLTGVTQVVFADNAEVATAFYTVCGFIGCALIFRAATIALPDVAHRHMAIAVMLWPSLVYWPSSVGKEAIVLLGIGLFTVGAARRFKHDGGFVMLAAGSITTGMVRPHVALLLLGSLLIATVLAADTEGQRGRTAGKVFLVVLLVGGLFITSGEALQLVETADDSTDSVGFVEDRTNQGGSAFDPVTVRSPADYPRAVVTVLLRPFPWETSNAAALISAAEGVALVGVIVLRIRHMLRLPGEFRIRPLIGYSLVYIAAFCYAFSPFANFGLLARQRTQVIPFVLLLVLMPTIPELERAREAARSFAGRGAGTTSGAASTSTAALPAEAPRQGRWRSNVIAPPQR